jgi:hypothetical protein
MAAVTEADMSIHSEVDHALRRIQVSAVYVLSADGKFAGGLRRRNSRLWRSASARSHHPLLAISLNSCGRLSVTAAT